MMNRDRNEELEVRSLATDNTEKSLATDSTNNTKEERIKALREDYKRGLIPKMLKRFSPVNDPMSESDLVYLICLVGQRDPHKFYDILAIAKGCYLDMEEAFEMMVGE